MPVKKKKAKKNKSVKKLSPPNPVSEQQLINFHARCFVQAQRDVNATGLMMFVMTPAGVFFRGDVRPGDEAYFNGAMGQGISGLAERETARAMVVKPAGGKRG